MGLRYLLVIVPKAQGCKAEGTLNVQISIPLALAKQVQKRCMLSSNTCKLIQNAKIDKL